MRTPPWPRAIRKVEKVHFVDLIQHRHRGPLDDLVFQHRHPDRALAAIRLRYVHPLNWARSICTPGQLSREILKIDLQVLSVLPPGYSVNSRSGLPLEAVVRLPKRVNGVDVVHQRGQLPSLLSLCCLTYPLQRLFHACPALHPVMSRCSEFPLTRPLLSTASAAGRPALFGRFFDSTGLSDSSNPFILGYAVRLPSAPHVVLDRGEVGGLPDS